MKAILLALLGCLLICGGSFFAIIAPGDGQTGMFTFPLWGLGAAAGLTALNKARNSERGTMQTVGLFAAVALLSIAWSFYASETYTPPPSHGGDLKPAQSAARSNRSRF